MRMLWIAIIAVLFAAGAWLYKDNQHAFIDITKPVIGPAVRGVYATGTVEASVMMPIAPRSGARLMELRADESNKVIKGQILAQLEDDDLRHSLDELRSREALAKKEYERNASLLKQKAVSVEVYDRSKSEWLSATAATNAANAKLDYLKLLSPADGTIIRRDGEVGQLIPANQPVFWLSCCAPLRISVEVDEEDIAEVQPKQKVLIRADAFPGKTYHGEVQAITPKGDPISRSYRVRVGFTDETPLMIGMTAETNIITREVKDALLVPTSAVQDNKLWVIRQGKLAHIPVSIGAKGIKQTEIKEGITTDDSVVILPPTTLQEGQSPSTKLVAQEK